MWSASIVVRPPRPQNLPQMPFAQWDDPIQTLAPQCPDEPLAKRVRLRTADGRSDHCKAEPGHRSIEMGGKDRVVVVDDETIRVVGGDGLAQLLEGPVRGGMSGRVEVDDSA